ncbi:hypothetical protein D3C87_2076520 [compost metagenome]
MSIIKTGIPNEDNCSDNTCIVLVFPVPVAPAIKPCLFNVFKGIFTAALLSASPFKIAPPRRILSPLV